MSRSGAPSPFGAPLFLWLVLVTAVPLVVMGTIEAVIFTRARSEAARSRLIESAAMIAERIDADIDMHARGVDAAAGEIVPGVLGDHAALNARLARLHRLYPGFLTMLIADREGTVVARSPERMRDGRPFPSEPLSVADRNYFTAVRETMRPYVSGIFQGRGFGSDRIVAVSAPVRSEEGAFAGIVEGSLDLGQQKRFASAALQREGTRVVVTDQTGRVVFAEGVRMPATMTVASGLLAATRNGSVTSVDLDGEEHLVGRVDAGRSWIVLVSRPTRLVHEAAGRAALVGALAVFAALAVSGFLARVITTRATEPLLASEKRYRDLVDQSLGLICTHDLKGIVLDVNPATAEALGRGRETIVGRPLADLTPREHASEIGEYLRRIEEQGHDEGLITVVNGAGERRIWTYRNRLLREKGRMPYVIGNAADITERWRLEQHFRDRSMTDALTGLANRTLFEDRLQHALDLAERAVRAGQGPQFIALLYLDLDGFKAVNDREGHAAGDALLREIGQRVRSCFRKTDTVARVGGDEFAVLLTGLDSAERASAVAGTLAAAVQRPVDWRGGALEVSVSMGISVYPRNATDANALQEAADRAMYEAKRSRRRWVVSDAVAQPPVAGPQFAS